MTYGLKVDSIPRFDDELQRRRAQLVHFCLRFSQDPDVAEDLAQETLIEAWRHRDNLREREAITAWLYGIARNVCLRWLRREAHERARRVRPAVAEAQEALDWTQDVAADFDMEVELERGELSRLLDQALALLPPETRAVLLQKYVENSPHAEIAERLGLSEGAVAMRVQRGKLALRRALGAELAADGPTFDGVLAGMGEWQETRLWCPLCGQSRLRALPSTSAEGFTLECPNCSDAPGGMLIQSSLRSLFGDITSVKAAYSRFRAWSAGYSERALQVSAAPCCKCGASAPLRQGVPPYAAPQHRETRALHVFCERCQSGWWSSLNGLTLLLPAVHHFWNEHPRIRMLPPQELAGASQPLLVTRVESLRDNAQMDVIHAADTLRLIEIHHGNRT